MSFSQLDDQGKPIPADRRTRRTPATRLENGLKLFHYQIYVAIPQPDGKLKHIRKRFWLPNPDGDDLAAREKEREMRHRPPCNALTWVEAHRKWLDENKGTFSEGHINTSRACIRQWCEAFGKKSTVEGTSLAEYSKWIAEKAKEGTGRAAQIKHEHMLAIARWCRSLGLIGSIPFEHSPKPRARTKPRRAATVAEYFEYSAILPESMKHLWQMLALTGMRITAACELLEEKIGPADFMVQTKFRKWITYPITPEIQTLIEAAQAFKAERGIDSPYLFTKDNGRPWKKDYFTTRLHRTAEAENKRRKAAAESEHGPGAPYAAIPLITAHQLRHMAGTVLGEQNMSADIIQAGLAHDSRASAETYVDKTSAMRGTALKVIAKALSSVEKVSKNDTENGKNPSAPPPAHPARSASTPPVTCPCCGHKFQPVKE